MKVFVECVCKGPNSSPTRYFENNPITLEFRECFKTLSLKRLVWLHRQVYDSGCTSVFEKRFKYREAY
ncbi:MAG: hypothetical protein QXZ04_00035 [Thermoproteota archaeon]